MVRAKYFLNENKKRHDVLGASSVQNLVSIRCTVVVSTALPQLDTLLDTVKKSVHKSLLRRRAIVVIIKNGQSVGLYVFPAKPAMRAREL